MATGALSSNMINAGSGITPGVDNSPPPYYSLGVSPDLITAMGNYDALPQIAKYKEIYDALFDEAGYAVLRTRWDELQLGSWPALTDGAPYPGIADFSGGPAPVNTWNLTAYNSTGADDPAAAGPPDWRVPYAPRDYYAIEPDARYQTRFVLTNARLIMCYADPRGTDESRDLTKFAQVNGICSAWRTQANEMINSSVNSEILATAFPGMQSLSTGGVSQVSASFGAFGRDLLALGQMINLAQLDYLGYPSTLLRQILAVGGILPGIYDTMLGLGMSETVITDAQRASAPLPPTVEADLYRAFGFVIDEDLVEVLELLDITTAGITSMAQLLDPVKIFPQSYDTLQIQVPQDGSGFMSVPIYQGTAINSSVGTLFDQDETYRTLSTIIPADQALANSALIRSLYQVKNIKNIEFRDFATSTSTLENNTGLGEVNALTAPVPPAVQSTINSSLATGTGPDGTITLFDMIGTAAGHIHTEKFNQTLEEFKLIDFTELIRLYDLCINVILGVYDVNYYSINPPTLTSGGSGYTAASATIDAPIGDYCRITPTFTVTVAIDPGPGTGPVSSITATNFGSGYRSDDQVNITIVGDGGGAEATTTIGPPSFAMVELPDGRQFQSCGDAISGRLEALKALIYSGSGGDNNVPGPWNTVEAEAKRLVVDYPEQVEKCNDYWAQMASQLNTEAKNRYPAELVFDFADPPSAAKFRDLKDNSRPSALALISSLQSLGTDAEEGGPAAMFEKIAQNNNLGGQSVTASLREGRNNESLLNAGVGSDTQLETSNPRALPATLSPAQ